MSQRSELIQTIQDIENGLAMNPTGEILERLTSRLARAKAKLDGLDEKKSVELSANQGQLPEPAMTGYIPTVERDLKTQHRDQTESIQAFEVNRVVIARIENPKPVAVPVVEMDFKDRYSNVYTRKLDQADIIALLKTYFKRVAVRMAKDGQYTDAYTSSMGQTVWKLFNGWHLIHKKTGEGVDYPVKEECFPGLKNASQAQKVCAELLHRWASNETP